MQSLQPLIIFFRFKDNRDSHFSCLTVFLKSEMMEKKLSSSQDIVDAINKHQNLSNIERIKQNKIPIRTVALIHNYSNDKHINQNIIQDLKCFYNLYSDSDYKINSKIYTDLNDSKGLLVKSKEKKSLVSAALPFATEKAIEPVNENLDKLWAKNNKIENFITKGVSNKPSQK